jgi:carboxylesterase type B
MPAHLLLYQMLKSYILPALVSLVAGQSVQVHSGTINGIKCPNGVNTYLGIPFAQPPTGKLRFQPPQAYGTYPNGAINATSQPASCIQFSTGFASPGAASEDCLYLNVYTPANATSGSNLPVKYWIYGGSFLTGSIDNPLYDACNIASNAVIVQVNYRVGPLGFLYAPNASIHGNMGIQDQLAGLQWVQTNIGAFGGDPKHVEVFGQSAGAISTWILSTLPQAASLMSAAVAESGAGVIPATVQMATNLTERFSASLGCETNNASITIMYVILANNPKATCYQEASPAAMLSAQPTYLPTEPGSARLRFGPLIDGKIIPQDPNSVGSQVPLIAGTTISEGTLFAILQYPDPSAFQPSNYSDFLRTSFGNLASAVNATYPLSQFNSTAFPTFNAISQIVTDFFFFCPSQKALKSTVARGQPAYAYHWYHVPTCLWEVVGSNISQTEADFILSFLNASHTVEIPFVFNTTTNLPLPSGNCSFTSEEDQIAEFMVNSWTNMAETKSPGQGWPKWDAQQSQGLLVKNTTEFGTIDYSKCDFVDDVLQAVLNGSAGSSI